MSNFGVFFKYWAESDGIIIRAAPNFLPAQSKIEQGRWFWSYHIRIENSSDQNVQLLTRHWIITDGRANVTNVDGEGVVGEQPVIKPGGAHDYVSGCPLATPTGSMQGQFRMRREDGSYFLAQIPKFNLIAPASAK
ncbi:Co2+/Mg2+ efflux protein ApaG [Sphingorhabdus lutea]|uniref:Co2+/Mg2+ efflux protein ApaG n=1 Tax=Sphingorhabdus lutea TaxID=1913578 RepID=A0A1L3JBN9_9SPHN|nr:Co2+/Mg2+ efflux protein ApaG [Sphingorhabdus lutea]APG62546.1 Co2+/Mg2+ efflux protein ApaG [Sphingorhabdus lutea]